MRVNPVKYKATLLLTPDAHPQLHHDRWWHIGVQNQIMMDTEACLLQLNSLCKIFSWEVKRNKEMVMQSPKQVFHLKNLFKVDRNFQQKQTWK